MAYNANDFITPRHTYFSNIRKIRENESEYRDPKAREKIAELNEQKEKFVQQIPDKLADFYLKLLEDPLLKKGTTRLRLKNLIRFLTKVEKYLN